MVNSLYNPDQHKATNLEFEVMDSGTVRALFGVESLDLRG